LIQFKLFDNENRTLNWLIHQWACCGGKVEAGDKSTIELFEGYLEVFCYFIGLVDILLLIFHEFRGFSLNFLIIKNWQDLFVGDQGLDSSEK